MIKKYIKNLLTIGIIGLGIINFSHGAGFGLSNSGTLFDGDCLTAGGSDFCIDSHFNITNSEGYKFGKLNVGGWNDRYIFWKNGMLYYYQWSNSQSFITGYYLSDDPTTTNPTWSLNAEDFYSGLYGNNFSKYYYFYWNNAVNYYICPYSVSTSQYVCLGQTNTSFTGSLGYDLYGLTYSEINALIQPESSPFNGGGGNGGSGGITINFGSGAIELGSDESALNYYEKRYGRDESICYVGVDNYTDLYGTRVSFEEGSGLTIFEVFSGLYGNSDLDKVYKWINAWLINYEEWWVRYDNFNGPNPSMFAFYNSGTNQVDYVFTGLDTSPFINQPVAIYFMANNIYDKSPYSTMGSSVVSYCNLKLLSGTYEEIIDEADKNNITTYTEQSNKNLGLNPDGTVVNIDFGNFGNWTGDSRLSSGVEIAFSGNTSVKNTLKNFFTQFDSALSGLDISTSTRILPTWLVTAFLFVVLFKFLKKRS